MQSNVKKPVDNMTLVEGALLLTEREAAERLRISRRMLWSLRSQGKIAYVRIGKSAVRYSLDALNDFIKSNQTALRA